MIQRDPELAKIEQRSQSVLPIMLGVMVVLLLQLWLITIALESYLAANMAHALPTFLASLVCFALNLWLLRGLYRLDSKDGQNER
jgi:hypothetical protein